MTHDHPLRVILVGRTGLDQSLRRDAGLELVRAADSFDAVGELGDPIDEHSPERTVVVVAPAAEPDGPERDAFLDALREVDADAPVLLVTRFGAPAGYDGTIDPSSTPEELFSLLRGARRAGRGGVNGTHPGHTPARVQTPLGVHTPPRIQAARPELAPTDDAVLPIAAPRTDLAGTGTGDQAVLAALLAGEDVVRPALDLIRARLGRDDVAFAPGADEASPGVWTPVSGGGATLGRLLVGDAGDAEREDPGFRRALEDHAGWLGSWLRLREQHRRLRQAAFTDPLTGAWNRRYFDHYLEAAMAQVRAARLPLTVMVFDIDDFKAYNDRFGHAAGDEILVETVRLLRSVIRPSDRVCRIGGDEFAVVFYEPTGPRNASSRPPESIYRLATRFQKQICEHRFPKLGAEAQGTLTISGGLATYPWDGTDAAALLARADELAIRSKQLGKNAITLGPGAESVCRPPGDDRG